MMAQRLLLHKYSASFPLRSRAARLQFGRGGIAQLEMKLGEAPANGGIIRRLADSVLELDLGGLEISCGDVPFGLLDKGGSFLGARSCANDRAEERSKRRAAPETTALSLEHRVLFFRLWGRRLSGAAASARKAPAGSPATISPAIE